MTLQSRIAELITAIGADVKADRTTMGTLASLTTTAKTSLVAAINEVNAKSGGSGSDPWTHQALSSAWTNSTVTGLDVFTGFTPAANTRYIVDCLLSASSAATATGIQTGLAGPTTGITSAAVKISSPLTATTEQLSSIGLNAFSAPATSLTTPQLILLQAIVEVGATPGAGNIRLQARSEVAASVITLRAGSSMRWRTI